MNNFNLDDLKEYLSSSDTPSNQTGITLESVLSDFSKDSSVITVEKEQQPESVPHVEFEEEEIKRPDGFSVSGAFDAIKTEKQNKQPEPVVESTLPNEPAQKEAEQVDGGKEILTPIENKRFFNTDTFNSIKDKSSANIKDSLASFVNGEDEEDDGQEEFFKPVEPTEEIDDYNKIEDRQDIIRELKKINTSASAKVLFTFILTCASALVFAINNSFIKLSFFNPEQNFKIYTILLMAISIFATIVNINSIIDGVKSLLKFKFTTEACLFVILLLTILIDVLSFFKQSSNGVVCFDFVYMLFVYFNIYSKKAVAKTIYKNFLITSADGKKSVINKPTNEEAVNDIMLETGCNADIVYASKSEFISNFIDKSFSDFDSRTSRIISILLMIDVVIAVVNFFVFKNIELALIYLLSAFCVTFPILFAYSFSLPLKNNSKKARKQGGVIIGSVSADELKDVQTLIVDDADVFNASLNGIRLYGQNDVDNVILYLNSLYSKVGGPLFKLFSDMLSDDIASLPRIDEIYYHDTMGYSGLIHSKVFVVGNKNLMDHFGVEVDDSEFEILYQQKSKYVLFVAYDGKLMGVFLLSYALSHGIKQAFDICEKNQIAVCIAERDANVNEQTLFNAYKPKEKVLFNIISFRTARHCFDKFELRHKTPSHLISHTGIKGLAAALHGCKSMQFAFRTNKIITRLSAALAVPLITFLLFFSQPSSTLPVQVLIYQLLWSIPIFFVSMFSK